MQSEEFAGTAFIEVPVQNGANFGLKKDFSLKSIQKTNTFVLNSLAANNLEFEFVLRVENLVEIRSVRIGFNSFCSDNANERLFGIPSTVYLEISADGEKYNSLGKLSSLNEESFEDQGIKVFGTNIYQFSNEQTVGNKQKNNDLANVSQFLNFKSQGLKENSFQATYFKFRILKPQLIYFDKLSLLSKKNTKNCALSVNFVSIRGYLCSSVEKVLQTNTFTLQEQISLQIITQLCSENFKDTISYLAQNESVLQKIKESFVTFQNLLTF